MPSETGTPGLSTNAKRIAVSGAGGLIGSRLVPALRQRGHRVVALVRRKPTVPDEEIYWDPQTAEIEADKLEGIDVVIHLAGKPLDGERWTPKVKAAIYASRVDSTALICRTLAQVHRRPGLLITASATDFYASSASPVDEVTGHPGTGFVSEMCQAWEAAAAAARDAGIRVVHLRIPSVLAAGDHGMLATFLPLFKLGLGPTLGHGRQVMCFVALDDMVRAIEHIIDREDLTGPVNVLGEVADAVLEGDADLRPTKLIQSGFQFLYPDITTALRHELDRGDDHVHPSH
jgi:uncharacterized protein (TIGR01777 family)